MICQNCGEKLKKNSKFCPNCGNAVLGYAKNEKQTFEQEYKKFLEESGYINNDESDKIEELEESNLKELDEKVCEELEKIKIRQTTTEDIELEDLSDIKYITCKNCNYEVIQGMDFCPKCGEKLPYAKVDDNKKSIKSLFYLIIIVIISMIAGIVIYISFTNKNKMPQRNIPKTLPGGETISPNYDYSGNSPLFFPIDSVEDDEEAGDEYEDDNSGMEDYYFSSDDDE